MSTGNDCAYCINDSYISGSIKSSESTNPMNSPRAAAIPTFLACAGPLFSIVNRRNLLSFFAKFLHIISELSSEPSLTMITSKF